MIVKVKKLCDNAIIPTYAHSTDAGMDLYATSKSFDRNGNYVYGTGIAVEIPEGYVGLIFPRSSISKTDLFLTDAVGVIDSGYRGEITAKFKSSIRCIKGLKGVLIRVFSMDIFNEISVGNIAGTNPYDVGERIAQLIIIPYPKVEFKEVEELSKTDREDGGYGSTGR
jgi:dUTP pyrophosphatase